jgi:outer membrane protein assembly factor BamB
MMKQAKILVLVAVVLLPLMVISCGLFGGGSVSGGWAGTAFRDGIIYAGTRDGRVVAVNSSNQDVLWSYVIATTSTGGMSCGPTSTPTAIYTTPTLDGDLVHVGTYGGEVYALTRADGELVWVYPPKGEGYIGAVVGSPVIANGIMYIGSSDGKIYTLNITNGKRKWETDSILADKLWTSPAVADDAIYVSTLEGHICALSAETGSLLDWSFEAEAGFASAPVIDEGTIYVGSFDRRLYAIEIGSNASMWRFPEEEPADNWFWASPVVSGGVVYAACLDGKLYAVEARTGEELWEFDAGEPIVSSPVLTGERLIVIDQSGVVYVFDLLAGTGDQAVPLKTISTGAGVKSSFCAHDGLVYVRSENNSVYVVDIDEGEVADGWPISLTVGE